MSLCEGEDELREGEVSRQTSVWSPYAFTVSYAGLGEFPLLLQPRVSAHHADDDGCVVHHVFQVRGLNVHCGCDDTGDEGARPEGGCYLSASS